MSGTASQNRQHRNLFQLALALFAVVGIDQKADGQLVTNINGLSPLMGFFRGDEGSTVTFHTASFPFVASIDERGFRPTNEEPGLNRNDLLFSSDGGASPRPFGVQEAFDIGVTVRMDVLDVEPNKQAGLRVEGPSNVGPNLDGLFYVDSTTSEVIVLGSVLPYFNFTEAFGLLYVPGDDIRLRMVYMPPTFMGESVSTIGTMEYIADTNEATFTSGAIEFADPNFGIVDGSTIGVFEQAFQNGQNSADFVTALFADFDFNGDLPNPNADFDANNFVDGADALRFQVGLGISGTAVRLDGDATFDHAVTSADLDVLKVQFGLGPPPMGILAPEPCAAYLAATSLLLLHRCGSSPKEGRRVV